MANRDDRQTNGLDAIIAQDIERKREKQKLRRTDIATCRDYIGLLKQDPRIAQRSHPRFHEIVIDAGVEEIPPQDRWFDGVDKRYLLFSKELYGSGIDKAVQDLMEYFAASLTGDSLARQLVVIVGPPASGKSTMIDILMRALEAYTRRPIFHIQGCPVRHDPLFLIPRYLQESAAVPASQCIEYPTCEQEGRHLHLGVKIVGDLCPPCRQRLLTDFTTTDEDGTEIQRWWDFPVEQFTFSIQGSRGIGTFEPGDDLSSDIATLTGHEDIQVTSTRGHEDPWAYDLHGEIEKANRGILEGVEMLLNKPDILRVFISLCEEGQIKVQGSNFPHLWIDTVPIGHVNIVGFKKFSTNKEYEGLHNRAFIIPAPYPLRVKDEVRIYEKLMRVGHSLTELRLAHIAPGSLELAALFAVATRLKQSSQGISPILKAKIFNGDIVLAELSDKDKKGLDIREMIREGQKDEDVTLREGMWGVSSRDVMAALSTAHKRQSDANGCLTPKKTIKALYDVFDHRMGFAAEDIVRYRELLIAGEGDSIMTEYRRFVLDEVTRAFLRAYEDLVVELRMRYLDNVRLHRSQKRKLARGQVDLLQRNEITGKAKEPDEKLMRSVEQHAGIDQTQAETFRGEIVEIAGPIGDYDYPPLTKAVEKKLLADTRESLTLVLATDRPKSQEEQRRSADLFSGLKDRGFCEVCAKELVRDATEFLSE